MRGNDFEPCSRSRFIRVKGLPEDEKEDIEDKLLDLFGYLGMELGRGDIERANRVGKVKPNATHARLVNVELHSHAVKIELLRRGIRLRNTQMAIQDDLTNVKMANVIEPVHDHEDHPHDCGLLNFVAAPEDYGKVRFITRVRNRWFALFKLTNHNTRICNVILELVL